MIGFMSRSPEFGEKREYTLTDGVKIIVKWKKDLSDQPTVDYALVPPILQRRRESALSLKPISVAVVNLGSN